MPAAPFVLLDDAREGGAPARLYTRPVRVLETAILADVPALLAAVRQATRDGLHAAGFLSYDAAPAFEPAAPVTAQTSRTGPTPLLWFGLFNRFEPIDPAAVPALFPDPAGAWIGPPKPLVDEATYRARLQRVLDLIRAGDVYQANLTFQAHCRILGDPLALYARLRAAARAGWGALVDTGATCLLSFSPELFFSLDAGRLTCRPMKGTAARLADARDDEAAVRALRDDPKQRAENLMIVDLMRNDLSRVAAPGSVSVPELFAIETYPTVHQMTSTVTARLADGCDAIDVLGHLFPCGSITGAPKVRAMQVIAEVEGDTPRGAYTGAIGRLDAGGAGAMFNVAIRTLTLPHGSDTATLGLGSGIVADSDPAAEWAECRAKGAFLSANRQRFDLLETMRFEPAHGILLLDRHLTRMAASAAAFARPFAEPAIGRALANALEGRDTPARVRLLLSPDGTPSVTLAPLPASPARMTVVIVPLPVATTDFRLRHKTSDRAFYDAARTAAAASDEVVFERPDGFLTEGSFTSLFVARGAILLTPPLAHGLLPGTLRAELLATGRAVEHPLTRADLANGFLLGNALRGLLPATLLPDRSPPQP